MADERCKVVLLAGGVGGAKMAEGLAAHDARISAGAAAFYDFIRPHLAITPHSFADMEKTYASLLGGLSPTAGHMVTVTA